MTTPSQAQVALVALIIISKKVTREKSNKELCLEPSDTEKGGEGQRGVSGEVAAELVRLARRRRRLRAARDGEALLAPAAPVVVRVC